MKQYSLFLMLGGALLVGIIGAQYLLKGSFRAQQTSEQSPLDPALGIRAALQLERIDDRTMHIPDFKGRPLMINFWASWCGPCMTEMPSIYALHKKFKGRGFEILAINLDVDANYGVRALTKRFGKPEFPIVRGHGEKYPEIFRIEGVPFTVLIDRSGKIRYAQTGERNWLDKDSLKLVEGIL